MINVWESVDAAKEARGFCDVYGLDLPVLLDESGDYISRTHVRGVPFNLVVDESGTVVAAGLTDPKELIGFLEARGWIEAEPDETWRRSMFLDD